jgi:hypothetical protein
MQVIIFAPFNYGATRASHAAGRLLYNALKREKVKTTYIPTRYCRREIAERVLETAPEELIIAYFGHGHPDRICGDTTIHCSNGKLGMIDILNYPDLLKGNNYIVACWTSRLLGKKAVHEGKALSYTGFDIPAYIAFDKSEHPYMQDFARVYGLTYVLSLLKTNDTKYSFKELKGKIEDLIKAYKLKSDIWRYAEHYASRHISNLRHLKLYKK